jgi:hypothetical protein
VLPKVGGCRARVARDGAKNWEERLSSRSKTELRGGKGTREMLDSWQQLRESSLGKWVMGRENAGTSSVLEKCEVVNHAKRARL